MEPAGASIFSVEASLFDSNPQTWQASTGSDGALNLAAHHRLVCTDPKPSSRCHVPPIAARACGRDAIQGKITADNANLPTVVPVDSG